MTIPTLLCIHIWAGCTATVIHKITDKKDSFWGRIKKIIVSIVLAPFVVTLMILEVIDEINKSTQE